MDVDDAFAAALRWSGRLLLMGIMWITADQIGSLLGYRLRHLDIDRTIARYSAHVVRWGIVFGAAYSTLHALGLAPTITALAATGGVAVGFANQTVLSNLGAGCMLLFARPYKVGDKIRVSGTEGFVNEIGLLHTYLDTTSRQRILVPNGLIMGQTIVNFSANPWLRVDILFGTPRGKNVPSVQEIDRAVLAAVQDLSVQHGVIDPVVPKSPLSHAFFRTESDCTMRQPAPKLVLREVEDLALRWELRVFCVPTAQPTIKNLGRRAVVQALEEIGIREGRILVPCAHTEAADPEDDA